MASVFSHSAVKKAFVFLVLVTFVLSFTGCGGSASPPPPSNPGPSPPSGGGGGGGSSPPPQFGAFQDECMYGCEGTYYSDPYYYSSNDVFKSTYGAYGTQTSTYPQGDWLPPIVAGGAAFCYVGYNYSRRKETRSSAVTDAAYSGAIGYGLNRMPSGTTIHTTHSEGWGLGTKVGRGVDFRVDRLNSRGVFDPHTNVQYGPRSNFNKHIPLEDANPTRTKVWTQRNKIYELSDDFAARFEQEGKVAWRSVGDDFAKLGSKVATEDTVLMGAKYVGRTTAKGTLIAAPIVIATDVAIGLHEGQSTEEIAYNVGIDMTNVGISIGAASATSTALVALGLAAGPVGWVALGVGIGVSILLSSTGLDKAIVDGAIAVGSAIVDGAKAVGEAVADGLQTAGEVMGQAINSAVDGAKSFVDGVGNFLGNLF